MRDMASDSESLMNMLLSDEGAEFTEAFRDVFNADVYVNFAALAGPDIETVNIKFSLADVPAEKALLPKLVKVAEILMSETEEDAETQTAPDDEQEEPSTENDGSSE
jgi:hypothetical protein